MRARCAAYSPSTREAGQASFPWSRCGGSSRPISPGRRKTNGRTDSPGPHGAVERGAKRGSSGIFIGMMAPSSGREGSCQRRSSPIACGRMALQSASWVSRPSTCRVSTGTIGQRALSGRAARDLALSELHAPPARGRGAPVRAPLPALETVRTKANDRHLDREAGIAHPQRAADRRRRSWTCTARQRDVPGACHQPRGRIEA